MCCRTRKQLSEEGSVHEYVTDRANEADEVMRYISTLSRNGKT